jgi:hypothetical protein
MIKIKKLNSFYIITKIKEHKKIKKEILNLIEEGNFNSFDNINKTDWHFNKKTKRKYLDYFYKIITPYMNKICKKINAEHWKISNGWFQEYTKGNFHDWHRHMEDHFANVYYLHLPDKKNTTKIKDPLTGKEFNIDAKEGDFITFPAYVLHTSEKILSDKTKIIISFNSSFGGYIKC